jgi:hypothetical protein
VSQDEVGELSRADVDVVEVLEPVPPGGEVRLLADRVGGVEPDPRRRG